MIDILFRFIRIFAFSGFSGCFYLLLGYKAIKRNQSKFNLYLFLFFFLNSILFFFNLVYSVILVSEIAIFLHNIAIFSGCFSYIFLVFFNRELISKVREKTIFPKIYLLVYVILLFGLFFIPDGVRISQETEWKPVWGLNYSLYLLFLCSSFITIPFLLTSIKALSRFQERRLKQKYYYYLLGTCGYIFIFYFTLINNILNNLIINIIYFFLAILVFPFCYLIYLGIGRY
jgi:hypothetical protein